MVDSSVPLVLYSKPWFPGLLSLHTAWNMGQSDVPNPRQADGARDGEMGRQSVMVGLPVH